MQLNKIWDVLNFKTSAKLFSCTILVIVADFLFYKQEIGWTLGFFGLMLIVFMHLHNKMIEEHKLATIASYASLGLTFALIENPSEIAFWLFYFSLIFMAVAPKLAKVDDARKVLMVLYRYLLTGWYHLYRDNIIIAYAIKRLQKTTGRKRALIKNWLLPVGLSAVFIILFAQANPIINTVLSDIRWTAIAQYFSLWRILFWLLIACTTWALIRPKLTQRAYHNNKERSSSKEFTLMALLFNERSILTSLILFNVLFFMQNLMDIMFLWSGAELPIGMTHAQYAHHGAYPLIATVLLTAVFILIAFKPKSAIEAIPVIRSMVYVWVGQNVFLVASSITRLINYIGDYSLTYLRVSALIWMGLVALGLILIVARIYMQRSNKWLVNINAFALYSTLYICCFINFGAIIAEYNVKQSRQIIGNEGVELDVYYLQKEVGEDAIPALLWFEQNKPEYYNIQRVQDTRKLLQIQVNSSMSSWRSWTFRKFRLLQHVDKLSAGQE